MRFSASKSWDSSRPCVEGVTLICTATWGTRYTSNCAWEQAHSSTNIPTRAAAHAIHAKVAGKETWTLHFIDQLLLLFEIAKDGSSEHCLRT